MARPLIDESSQDLTPRLSKINVWGLSASKGSYWTVYRFETTATYIDGAAAATGWVPLKYNDAIIQNITENTLNHFMSGGH